MKKQVRLLSMVISGAVMMAACEKADLDVTTESDAAVTGDSCQFRTQTPGGWGSKPSGKNPGSYLHANFSAAFPSGLTVGCSNYSLTLTTAQAITDFLPQGGTPNSLSQSYVDPTSKLTVLAGHLVALTLSTTFDDFDGGFGLSNARLGDQVINTGAFAGQTIDQLLQEANNVLGGCVSSYTPSDISDALALVNQNYVDGTRNNGTVDCEPSDDDIYN